MTQIEKLQTKAREQLRSFLADCGVSAGEAVGRRILEIGFKNGHFLNACREAGLLPCGIDVREDYCQDVRRTYPGLNVLWYDGGAVPLADASFDYIVSFQVLEHVESVEHVLAESRRLLKDGGMMYHVCPNYRSFYEGHFKVIWLPFLGRRLGRLYLKLLRRYRPQFEQLNLVRPTGIRKAAAALQGVEVLSTGRAEFQRHFGSREIGKVDQPLLRGLLGWLDRRRRLRNLLLKLIAGADVYYPIILIARRREGGTA